MGCNGSSQKPTVEAARRRLSVGHTDESVGNGSSDPAGQAQADRGLIAALDSESLWDMLGQEDDSQTAGRRRFSIGSKTDHSKTSFACKAVVKEHGEVCGSGLGYTCRKGLKPESPNQDSFFVLQCEPHFSIYGVFDGHGKAGHDSSEFVKNNLPKLVMRDARFKDYFFNGGPDELCAVMKDNFEKIQSLILTSDQMKKLDAKLAGTTATMCIHDLKNNKLTLAWVADSTAVLGLVNKTADVLTRDHKPDLPDERARIEKNGGRVVFDGYANHRVYAKNARYPGLNMSRCLGDLMGHQDCGISATPETKVRPLTADDKYLMLCSDGVWEFLKAEEAVEIVAKHPASNAQAAADELAKCAWDRWIKEEGGAVVDDITVVFVHLSINP